MTCYLLAMSVTELIKHSGFCCKGRPDNPFTFSVFSWSVIFDRFLNYRRFRKRAENYYKRVRNAKSIPEILNFSKNHSENPLKEMFLEVYSKLHEQVELNPQDTPIIRSAENLERTLQRVMRGQIMHLESGLAFLATTASATPFISLSK